MPRNRAVYTLIRNKHIFPRVTSTPLNKVYFRGKLDCNVAIRKKLYIYFFIYFTN